MIITTSPQHYETLKIATRSEAQLLREVCVVSRPLIQEALTHADTHTPELLRRSRRTLQDIYHGVDSLNRSSRGKRFPEPFYLHVTPEEAHLLRHFLRYTPADVIYSCLDEGALGRVGSLVSVTTVWDALRLRWTGDATMLGSLKVTAKPVATASIEHVVVPAFAISSPVNAVA